MKLLLSQRGRHSGGELAGIEILWAKSFLTSEAEEILLAGSLARSLRISPSKSAGIDLFNWPGGSGSSSKTREIKIAGSAAVKGNLPLTSS